MVSSAEARAMDKYEKTKVFVAAGRQKLGEAKTKFDEAIKRGDEKEAKKWFGVIDNLTKEAEKMKQTGNLPGVSSNEGAPGAAKITGSGFSSAIPTMFAGSGGKLGAAIGSAKAAGAVGGAALRGAGAIGGAAAGLVGGVGGKAKALLIGGALGATSFAFANSEFVFILLALAKYVFVDWLGMLAGIKGLFAMFLLFFAIATVLNGKGYLPAILLVYQLTYHGLAFTPAIAIPFSIIICAYIIFFGIERTKEDFKSMPAYLALVIYAIDTGIFTLIAKQYGLVMQPWFENIILLSPWWALLGIINVDAERLSSNFSKGIMKFLKAFAMLYIITTVIAAAVPQGAFTEAGLGLDDAARAKEEALAKLKQEIHPMRLFWIQLQCSISEPTSLEECKLRETIKAVCGEMLELGMEAGVPDDKNEDYQKCVARVKGEDVGPSAILVGGVDPSIIKFTKMVIDEPSSKIFDQSNVLVPVSIVFETPRSIDISVSCSFGSGEDAVNGRAQPSEFTIEPDEAGSQQEVSFLCSPESELKAGRHNIKTEVMVKNMQTVSRLARAFIGPQITPELAESIKDDFPAESLSPDEFAAVVFSLEGAQSSSSAGSRLPKSLIRLDSGSATLTSEIKNKGGGKIVLIEKAVISLAEGLIPDQQQCGFRFDNNNLVREGFVFAGDVAGQKTLPLGICVLRFGEPLVSKVPDDGYLNVDNIIATLDYSYLLERESSITVIGGANT